ncbi:hypothetical protein [Burkholderia vietnamiensis]|uniref:hypothetical protein n=1 Tax=Burkholderia vietnamiensis TaxID=60552 RepID=UPI0012D86C3F|nr:hypothetical protein [Burkholderia vietnamiensis]
MGEAMTGMLVSDISKFGLMTKAISNRQAAFSGWSVLPFHSIATTSAATGRTSQTSRIEVMPHFSAVAVAAIFDNRYSSSNGEAPFTNPIIVRASFQKLGASINEGAADDTTRFSFHGGSMDAVIPGGAVAITDALYTPIASGVRAFVKTFVTGTPLPIPSAPAVALQAGTGLGVGAFGIVVTIVYPGGLETPGSTAASITTTSGNNQIVVTAPTAASYPGAIGYRVWACIRGSSISASTLFYDVGSGVVPLGTNYTYTAEPNGSAPTASMQRVLGGQAASFPAGGGLNGGTGVTASNNGEYNAFGVDYSSYGRISTGGAASNTYGPVMLLGLDPAKVHASLAIVGDSIPTGTADYGFATAVGGYPLRAVLGQYSQRTYDPTVVPLMGWAWFSTGGEHASDFAGGGGTRRTQLASYCTDIFCDYGTNDLSLGTSAATIASYIVTIAARFTGQGKRFHQVPLLPRALSTDGWLSIANQYISNTTLEGNRRQFNNWVLSTGTLGPVSNEAMFGALAGNATPSTNLYAGGDGATTTFITAYPFRTGTEAIKVNGVTQVVTTNYTYYGTVTIGGVQYASGVVFTAAPAAAATVTAGYTPLPSYTAMCGALADAWDISRQVEVNAAGVATRNGGWWLADVATVFDSGTSSGSNTATAFNDATKAWTTNQYRGYVLRIATDSGNPSAVGLQVVIAGNAGTQIQLGASGFSAVPSASATYQVIDPITQDGTHPTTRGHMRIAPALPISSLG